MHACMFPPRSDCLCAARHECAHARLPCIITPTCCREDIFHACMYAGRYVCMFPPRSACLCAARHECVHARPPCITPTGTCYREDIFHPCMYAGRYVCMLPPRSACVCAIFPSGVPACSPAVHHRVYSLSQGYILWMYVCSTLGMYAATVFRMLVPCPPVSRVRMLAHRS